VVSVLDSVLFFNSFFDIYLRAWVLAYLYVIVWSIYVIAWPLRLNIHWLTDMRVCVRLQAIAIRVCVRMCCKSLLIYSVILSLEITRVYAYLY